MNKQDNLTNAKKRNFKKKFRRQATHQKMNGVRRTGMCKQNQENKTRNTEKLKLLSLTKNLPGQTLEHC